MFPSNAFKSRRSNKLSSRLRLEVLEERLTPTWAGVPPAIITPPTSFVPVTLNLSGDAGNTASITSNEVDWYRFVAPITGTYVFEATTPTSNLDTVIGVFSSAGTRLGFNDDISSTNRDSRFSISLTAGQAYFYGVTNFSTATSGAYSWRIDGPSYPGDDAFENNDTQATAFNFGTRTATFTTNNLVMRDGHDWYRFTTTGPGTSTSSVSLSFLHSIGDVDMEVFGPGGFYRISNGVTNSESISLNTGAAGVYYIHVYGFSGANNPNYSLTVRPPSGSPPPANFQIAVAFGGGLTTSQRAVFSTAAARWAQVITGDLPDAVFQGRVIDDVEISASGATIDGPGGILGQAGPDALRAGSSLPFHGVMRFDSADLAAMESSGQLLDVILHEMGHVLGIGTIWTNRGLLSGAGTSNPRFTGAQATAQYNAIFGRSETGVPVANVGGPGTRDSHWRESTFGAELMTGIINSGVANPMSRVTVASLADMGYTVNIAAADAYTPPPGSRTAGVSNSKGGGGASLRAASGEVSASDLVFLPVASPASAALPAASASRFESVQRSNDNLMSSLGGQNLGALLKSLGRGRGVSMGWLDDGFSA